MRGPWFAGFEEAANELWALLPGETRHEDSSALRSRVYGVPCYPDAGVATRQRLVQ